MKVVSFSTVYPTPRSPGRGVFVRHRLLSLSRFATVKVVAPVPLFDYGARAWKPDSREPARTDAGTEVLHPAWLYPPGGTPVNPVLLATAMLRPFSDLRERFPFDLIDAHFGYPESVAAAILARRFRTAFAVTLRGSELMHAKYPLRRRAIEWALRRAAHVIAVSQELKSFAIGCGVSPNRISVISNGVQAGVFHARDRSEVRRMLGIPLNRRLVVSAGHLIHLKRHDRVIRAIASLRSDNDPPSLAIIGGAGQGVSSAADELRALTAQLGLSSIVRFVGHVGQEELADWMSAADVFCSASSREGWPNVVHEALACGTPVVATRVGAIPDLLPGPEFGLISEVDDQSSLEANLGLALAKDWNRGAISKWAQSRSWDQVGLEVFREFSRLVHSEEYVACK